MRSSPKLSVRGAAVDIEQGAPQPPGTTIPHPAPFLSRSVLALLVPQLSAGMSLSREDTLAWLPVLRTVTEELLPDHCLRVPLWAWGVGGSVSSGSCGGRALSLPPGLNSPCNDMAIEGLQARSLRACGSKFFWVPGALEHPRWVLGSWVGAVTTTR